MSNKYITTRCFPAKIMNWVADLIPRHARSVRVWEEDETGMARASAHESEIYLVRRAIRRARDAQAVAHIR